MTKPASKRCEYQTLTRLTEADWKRIRDTAEAARMPLAQLIRLVIGEFLDGVPHTIQPVDDKGRND